MKAIILAAGSGNRMKPLTDRIPKCLLEINGQTMLGRLISQLNTAGVDDITVVVGYQKEPVIDEIQRVGGGRVRVVDNARYADDVNILSLTLALKGHVGPFHLFEADCIFEDRCFDLVFDDRWNNQSVWFSHGRFRDDQLGGIILADEAGKVLDVRIVDGFRDIYAKYHKMMGVLKVGPREVQRYSEYLFAACEANTRQYYHMPWIEHLSELPGVLCDLGHLNVVSFNTIEGYHQAQEVFRNEVGQANAA